MNRQQKRAKRMRAKQHTRHAGRPRNIMRTYADGTEIEVRVGRKPSPSFHKGQPRAHGERLDARGQMDKIMRELGIEDPGPELRREFTKLIRATGSAHAAKAALEATVKKVSGRTLDEHQERAKKGKKPWSRQPKTVDSTAEEIPAAASTEQRLNTACANLGGYSPENQAQFLRGDFSCASEEDVDILKRVIAGETICDIAQESPRPVADHGDEAYANRPSEEEWADMLATAKKRKRSIKKFAEKEGYTMLSDDHDPRERESWVKA